VNIQVYVLWKCSGEIRICEDWGTDNKVVKVAYLCYTPYNDGLSKKSIFVKFLQKNRWLFILICDCFKYFYKFINHQNRRKMTF